MSKKRTQAVNPFKNYIKQLSGFHQAPRLLAFPQFFMSHEDYKEEITEEFTIGG